MAHWTNWTRESMGEWLGNVLAKTTKTVLFVTHSVEEAAILSDRVVCCRRASGPHRRNSRHRSTVCTRALRTDEAFLHKVAQVRQALYRR
ncbi:MAG: hypothetical protein R2856_08200 [Caldilineaceae bacterium]